MTWPIALVADLTIYAGILAGGLMALGVALKSDRVALLGTVCGLAFGAGVVVLLGAALPF